MSLKQNDVELSPLGKFAILVSGTSALALGGMMMFTSVLIHRRAIRFDVTKNGSNKIYNIYFDLGRAGMGLPRLYRWLNK